VILGRSMTVQTHPSLTRRERDRTDPSIASHPPLLRRVAGTEPRLALTIARLGLGAVMFPHGAQKVLGWYGATSFGSSYTFFVANLHMPGPLAVFTILLELVSAVALVFGLLTRVAAFVMLAIMAMAIALVHAPHGFFMNWYGAKQGEGFEYHLLAITLALTLIVGGGGRFAVDRALASPRFERRP
jgi:putative oxidoreductase